MKTVWIIISVRNYLRVRGEYPLLHTASAQESELPPRARRIQGSPAIRRGFPGTTSACAENTSDQALENVPVRNYLRVRGEYLEQGFSPGTHEELPPRARRIPYQPTVQLFTLGTTSACAENTGKPPGWCVGHGNYLRVRGEYLMFWSLMWSRMELPPRARRIRHNISANVFLGGTTSACAENTLSRVADIFGMRNYLRVRGEYRLIVWQARAQAELPPRARRILSYHPRGTIAWGTTSACAENTLELKIQPLHVGNYLRVRGEYHRRHLRTLEQLELPPRARRIPHHCRINHAESGTTSACAENTCDHATVCHARWNYLRVRGEYTPAEPENVPTLELPPRARRIQINVFDLGWEPGTTSACAENTHRGTGPLYGAGNYLRVRGEYRHHNHLGYHYWELPPRARRIRYRKHQASAKTGTTSACAENTNPHT